jgi:uncharacterized damage-inducible protein DinB
MAATIQLYLSLRTKKIAEEMKAAYENIPEDKRSFAPMDMGRSAIDQLAEVAMLNMNVTNTITTHTVDIDFEQYFKDKAALSADPSGAMAKFEESIPIVCDAIAGASDDDMEKVIQFPWGPMTILEIVGYPLWNMSYHTGQINYIASLIGCLK